MHHTLTMRISETFKDVLRTVEPDCFWSRSILNEVLQDVVTSIKVHRKPWLFRFKVSLFELTDVLVLEIAEDHRLLVEHLEKLLIMLRLVVVLDGLYDGAIKFVLRVLDLVDVAESALVIEFPDHDPVLEPLLDGCDLLFSGRHSAILSVNSRLF